MNSKLIKGSLAGVAALDLAAGGTTMAAWSDFDEIKDNNAGAGILQLNVDPNQSSKMIFDSLKMAPGGLKGQRNVYVASNDGESTPSGKLFISVKDVVGTEDGCVTKSEAIDDPNCDDTTSEGDFINDAILQVTSYAVNSPGECTQGYAPAGKQVTGQYGGSLKKWMSMGRHEITGNGKSIGGVDKSYLAPGEGLCVSMDLSMGFDATNNRTQGDSAVFTTRFDLEQAPWGTPTKPIA